MTFSHNGDGHSEQVISNGLGINEKGIGNIQECRKID